MGFRFPEFLPFRDTGKISRVSGTDNAVRMGNSACRFSDKKELRAVPAVGLIGFVLFLTFSGFGMVIPVLPSLVEEDGAAPYHLGYLLGIYSLISFLTAPVWGALSDRWGHNRVIFTGLLGFGLSFWLFGMFVHDLAWMYVSRILGGLFSGAAIASSMAYLADATEDEARTRAMGIAGMSIGLGFVFGPAIGGILGHVQASLPFYAAAILSWFAALIVLARLPVVVPKHGERMVTGFGAALRLLRGRTGYLLVLTFLIIFSRAGLESTVVFYAMRTFGATSYELGILFTFVGLVTAFTQGALVSRIRAGQETRAIALGLLVSALGFYLIVFTGSLFSAILFVSVFALGNSLVRPIVLSLLTRVTPVAQGATSGANTAMDSLGRVLGPVVGGHLFTWEPRAPFFAGVLYSLTGLVVLYLFVRRSALEEGTPASRRS